MKLELICNVAIVKLFLAIGRHNGVIINPLIPDVPAMSIAQHAANHNMIAASLEAMKLEDFGKLHERYQGMRLAKRAEAVLADADVALRTADRLIANLSAHKNIAGVFEHIRKNIVIIGKMRPSEAKNILLDDNNDFLDVTRHKLAVWRKTMERISQGEGIVSERTGEYISSNVPLAMAIASASTVTNYLSIVQLCYSELAKMEAENAQKFNMDSAKVRRCSTMLSDCENAACFSAMVH
jgi:hypothetical protein